MTFQNPFQNFFIFAAKIIRFSHHHVESQKGVGKLAGSRPQNGAPKRSDRNRAPTTRPGLVDLLG